MLRPRVVVVGGGPAGLRAATDLAPQVHGEVLVLEREAAAGGIPRHSDHLGYGIRDLHSFISGPNYARRLYQTAVKAGATVMTNAMVTDWAGERSLHVTTPSGRMLVEADAVILATGARERPRAARLIPGARGSGVYTTGQLQNLVHLHHRAVGNRAVVVGAELVSWSAVMTLKHAGCHTVMLTTEQERPDSYAVMAGMGRVVFRTHVATRTRVTRIVGRGAVTAVEVRKVDSGDTRIIECDTVVFTGDWIPDNELARSGGLDIDPQTLGPAVDAAFRTNRPGVFAVGNLVHPVDTADVAALDGSAAAAQVVGYLETPLQPQPQVRILAVEPLRWVSPSVGRQGDPHPARNRILSWSNRYVRLPVVVVKQGDRVIDRRRLWWPAAPGRVLRMPSSLLRNVDWTAQDVTIGLEGR
jgi:thioredoxin reductase